MRLCHRVSHRVGSPVSARFSSASRGVAMAVPPAAATCALEAETLEDCLREVGHATKKTLKKTTREKTTRKRLSQEEKEWNKAMHREEAKLALDPKYAEHYCEIYGDEIGYNEIQNRVAKEFGKFPKKDGTKRRRSRQEVEVLGGSCCEVPKDRLDLLPLEKLMVGKEYTNVSNKIVEEECT